MKQLSATEAARRFSDVLDSVESDNETFVVVRHGRAVATIGPTAAGTGRALKRALRDQPADSDWVAELRDLRDSVGEGSDRWHD